MFCFTRVLLNCSERYFFVIHALTYLVIKIGLAIILLRLTNSSKAFNQNPLPVWTSWGSYSAAFIFNPSLKTISCILCRFPFLLKNMSGDEGDVKKRLDQMSLQEVLVEEMEATPHAEANASKGSHEQNAATVRRMAEVRLF